MDATSLLARLREHFPATQKSGVFDAQVVNGQSFAKVFELLGAPQRLPLFSEKGWQAEGTVLTLRGRTDQPLLKIPRPSLFLRLQEKDGRWSLLFGVVPSPAWVFTHSFPQHPHAMLGTLVCRALVVASDTLDVPLAWLRKATTTESRHNAEDDRDTRKVSITERIGLYGLDADASTVVAVDELAAVVARGSLKVSISLGFHSPSSGLSEENQDIAASLPADCANDSSLLRRNETWCALDEQRRITHAYLALNAYAGKGWPICDGVVLSDVQLRFSSIRPPDTASIQSYSLGARFTLGDVPLLINGHLPATTLSGSLDPKLPPSSLKSLVYALFKHEMKGDMTIDRLAFWAQIDSGQYGAELVLDGDWTFHLSLDRYLAFRRLEARIEKDLNGYSGHLLGSFRINAHHEFSIQLDFTKGATQIQGSWQANATPLYLNDMLRALHLPQTGTLPGNRELCLSAASFIFDSGNSTFALKFDARLQDPQNPQDGVEFTALLVAGKRETRWGFLCSMSTTLSMELGLQTIPLAGNLLDKDTPALKIERLRLVAASQAVPSIPQDCELIPEDSDLHTLGKDGIDSGLALAVDLRLDPTHSKTLMVRFGGKKEPPKALPPAANDAPAQTTPPEPEAEGETLEQDADKVSWIDLQRDIGPLHMQRIGFSMTDTGALAVTLDAGITTRGLSIGLRGLKADIPLGGKQKTEFSLAGLAIGFNSPSLSIRGMLNSVADGYDGELALSAGTFSATAMGSYSTLGDVPSFAAYTFISVPLGGPPCFFVTGLAGGLGYNRSLRLPEIDQVAAFPLVRAAMGSALPDQAKKDLGEYVQATTGQDWFAAGVRFSSFKMLESFVLLTVSFGARSEIALLGRSTLSLPPLPTSKGNNPMVRADLLIRASLQLEEGLLAVNAQLSPASYVFSPSARLTGGFAFYLWFGKHLAAGDFVVTLGGYHPQFSVPPHYPRVPRLGLNWRLSDNLTIKGELYFALTPALIMAGGLLEATWQSDGVRAWFQVQAHFLMRFKPFTYRISASVNIGVSARVDLWLTSYTLDARVSANLELWGPDFGGKALVDLSVISFTIAFGVQDRPSEAPITWDEFRRTFLPADTGPPPTTPPLVTTPSALISISAPTGLLGTEKTKKPEDTRWLVDGANLSLALGTQVPSTELTGIRQPDKATWNTGIGVGPMGKAAGALTSTLKVTLSVAGNDWRSETVLGNVPAGLWGNNGTDLKQTTLVKDALLGLRLYPPAPATGDAVKVAASSLSSASPTVHPLQWSQARPAPRESASSNDLAQLAAHPQRSGILAALARHKPTLEPTVSLDDLASAPLQVLLSPPLFAPLGDVSQ